MRVDVVVRRYIYIDFPKLLRYPYPTCVSIIPTSLFILKCFFIFKKNRFPHIYYFIIPTPLVLVISSVLQQHPYFFVHVLKLMFFVFKKKNKKNDKLRFFTSRDAYVNCSIYYDNRKHSFDWKSAVGHDGGV